LRGRETFLSAEAAGDPKSDQGKKDTWEGKTKIHEGERLDSGKMRKKVL